MRNLVPMGVCVRFVVIAAVLLGTAGETHARRRRRPPRKPPPPQMELEPVMDPAQAKLFDELRGLAKQKFWYELLNRLAEVPEGQRNALWTELLGEAAIGYLEGVAKAEDEWTTLMAYEDFRNENTVLKENRAFMKKRAEVGLKGFSDCFLTSVDRSSCAQKLVAFAQVDPTNGTLAFEGARMSAKYGLHAHAIELFAIAVRAESGGAKCSDEQLWTSTNWGLNQPSESVHTMSARDVAFKHCFKEVYKKVLAEFVRGDERYARNTCDHLVRKKKLLSRFQGAWCRDLLEGERE